MNISREQKLNELQMEHQSEHLSDYVLNIIYEKYLTMKNKIIDIYSEENPSEAVLKKVRESIIMRLINRMLAKSGLPKMEYFDEFVNIDKTVIVNDETKNIIDEMNIEIYDYFNKNKLGLHRKNIEQTPNYQLNLLRQMLSCVGYKLERKGDILTKNKVRSYENRFTIVKE